MHRRSVARFLLIAATFVSAALVSCVSRQRSAPLKAASEAATEVVGPSSQSINKGTAAAWTGTMGLLQTSDGNPVQVAWDFADGGSATLCTGTGTSACKGYCSYKPLFDGFRVPTGSTPIGIASGDLNGDGRIDLVVANYFGNSISVFLGRGDGSFAAKVEYATASNPAAVVVGDFNGDGILDVAATNQYANSVSIFLGRGDGTFGLKTDFPTAANPAFLAAGDFDKDGKLDLATAGTTVSVLLGNGDGTFAAHTDYTAGVGPRSIVTADLNRDGSADLVVANENSSTVSVFLGHGDGTFAPRTDFATGPTPMSVAVGDLNEDGNLDLVTTNQSLSVSVLLGSGTGSFGPKTDTQIPNNTDPVAVAIGDFDEDGHEDIAIANMYTNTISIWTGRGNGTFATRTDFVTGLQPRALIIGDFDGNGHSDVAFTESGFAEVLLGRGNGLLGPAMRAGTGPRAVASADFNRDGKPDLAIANTASNSVSVFLGTGGGIFARTDYPTAAGPTAIALADLNTDGNLDLAVADATGSVSILLGTSNGAFGPTASFSTGGTPMAIAAADFNGDRRTDLVVMTTKVIHILLGNGDGTFGPPSTVSFPSIPTGVAVGDFNRDGKTDLAIAGQTSNAVSILPGIGDGTFGAGVDYSLSWSPSGILASDLNGDGFLDLVALSSSVNSASILLGQAGGAFFLKGSYFTGGTSPSSVVTADLNGDGVPDLAVAHGYSNNVGVLIGNGDGSFQAASVVAAGIDAEGIAAGDFDGDGRQDVADANLGSNTVSILGGYQAWSCPVSTSHFYLDSKGSGPGPSFTWSPRLTVTTTSQSFTQDFAVTVHDVPPVARAFPNFGSIPEGTDSVSSVTWSQPGTNDAYAVHFDWGDGTASDVSRPVNTTSAAAAHLYPDAGAYTVSATVTDDEGTSSVPVTYVENVIDAPIVVSAVETNAPVPANSAATVWILLGTPGGDRFTYDFAWDGDSAFTAPDDVIASTSNTASFVAPVAQTRTVYVRVHDDDGTTASGQVTVEWVGSNGAPGNAPPIALGQALSTVENTSTTVPISTILAGDLDPDGDPISLVSVSQPAHGAVVVSAGSLTYTPGEYFSGSDSFYYTIADDAGLDATAPVSVTVTHVDQPPIAEPDSVIAEGVSTAFPAAVFLANDSDPDGDGLALTAVESLGQGSVSLSGGIVTFAPAPGFHGIAQFEYTVTAGALSATGLVTVTVLPDYGPATPVALLPVPGSTAAANPPTMTVSNVVDADGDSVTYEFEISDSQDFSNAIVSGPVLGGTAGTTSWTSPSLPDHTVYLWRARASDSIVVGDWVLSSFLLDSTNLPPTAPIPATPGDGSLVVTRSPTLSVVDAEDPEHDLLTYTFEVHADDVVGPIVAGTSGIPGGAGMTTFTVPVVLPQGRKYAWRARATDSHGAVGAWSSSAAFEVYAPSGHDGCDLLGGRIDFDGPSGADIGLLCLAALMLLSARGAVRSTRPAMTLRRKALQYLRTEKPST